jgi:trk system potassium uptake protein TrkA
MKVIIIGDGRVGYNLAESLSMDSGNDVTVIDKNAQLRRGTLESLDVRYIKGNGTSTNTLIDAGVRRADLLIAATSSDETNMVCSLTAKRLGVGHTVARIRDPEYADELSQIQADLGLDLVINPEQSVAGEIAKLVEFPPAMSVEMFAKGRVEMVEIKATPGMPIIDEPLKAISQKIYPAILIGAILRGDDVIIPDGETVVRENDTIYIIGHPSKVLRFCHLIGLRIEKIKNVMIIGGGRIGYYLAKSLDEIDARVKIIESSRDRCLALAEVLPRVLVINGDGSDDKMLHSENLRDMGCFISVTDKDEENLMTALLAKRYGVPKVIAKINRTGYAEIMSDIGIDNLVNPKDIVADYILRYVRGLQNATGNTVNALHRIIGDQAEAIEFTASNSSRLIDAPLKDLRLLKNVLVVVIVRKNEVIIPHGNDSIKPRDNVILITKGQKLSDLDDILAPG